MLKDNEYFQTRFNRIKLDISYFMLKIIRIIMIVRSAVTILILTFFIISYFLNLWMSEFQKMPINWKNKLNTDSLFYPRAVDKMFTNTENGF